MKYNWLEVFVGAAVLVVAIVFGYFIFSNSSAGSSANRYPLYAQFQSAEGVSTGGEIRMAGVKIGAIGSMSLDTENYMAELELLIDNQVTLPLDSEVKITSDGLLGGAFVEVIPGGDIAMLEKGDQFRYASGSISLLSLFAGFVTNGSKNGSDGE